MSTYPARADEKLDFFESKIRPLLVEHCYDCHSADSGELKGGLQLDNRAGLQKGGDSGPVVVAGQPANSLLMKAVRWESESLRMPPDGKLSDAQIADLEAWIKNGAVDPREGNVVKAPIEELLEAAPKHWSWKPIQAPPPPANGEPHPVDAFIVAKLKEAGLAVSPEADRRTLIRRAFLDLLGVPPTYAEVTEFEGDRSPQAWERLVDRLLADKRYGERWGRHWLDVVRYADTMGAIYNGDDSYPYAHTYRDWVIRAFNEDKPYDRFILEQIAADRLSDPPEPASLAAMGFLGVGRRKDRAIDDDLYDDTLDVIGRGLMGMTIGCARCHDHKLEPITTKDYYGLHGVLRNSQEPKLLPILPAPDTPAAREYAEKNPQARLEYALASVRGASAIAASARSHVGDYLHAAHEADWKGIAQHKPVTELLTKLKLANPVYEAFAKSRRTWIERYPSVFVPYLQFGLTQPIEPATPLHPLVAKAFATPAKDLDEVWSRYNELFAAVDKAWREQHAAEIARPFSLTPEQLELPTAKLQPQVLRRLDDLEKEFRLADPDLESLRQVLVAPDSPFRFGPDKFNAALLAADQKAALDKAAKAVTDLEKHPGAPVRAMAFFDAPKMYEGRVYVRGNPRMQGPPAPRKFLTALEFVAPEPFPKDSSGRLELARAIVDPKNPLTTRVIANRVWSWHFGEGIVRTPSDFGYRGEPPTHPELLDHLAAWFMHNGWSFKKLHRHIMLSRTYRQSSVPAAGSQAAERDPERKLLASFPIRQLEFEAYRDSILQVTGRLNPDAGGRPVPVATAEPAALRRTVYGLVDRKLLPSLYRNFDFPDPSFTSPKRSRSMLSAKALTLLNSPWIVDSAKALAADLAKYSGDDLGRIAELYRRVLQREPTEREIKLATDYLAAYPANDVIRPETLAWQYGYGAFDEAEGKVTGFAAMNAFDGTQFRGQAKTADGKPVSVSVSAKGGDPGMGLQMASIRVWKAPLDGVVKITAELLHKDDKTAGVVARVVSSRGGVLGTWEARGNAVMTDLANVAVKQGDELFFLVSGRDNQDPAAYVWAPTIMMPDAAMPDMPGMVRRWDARLDFGDPARLPKPLTAWEELVQVLLISPEVSMLE